MKLVKDLLPVLFRDAPAWKIKLLSMWPTIVGSIADNVILEAIENDIAIVAVKSSAWLHEINCLKALIIQKINHALGDKYITAMRFKNRVVPIKKKIMVIKKRQYSSSRLVLTEPQKIALSSINDAELQEWLKRFLLRCINETD